MSGGTGAAGRQLSEGARGPPPGPGILFPTEAWPLPSAEKAARHLLHLPFHFFYLFRSALSLMKWSAPQGRALTSAGARTPFGSLRHLDFPPAVAVIGADEGIGPVVHDVKANTASVERGQGPPPRMFCGSWGGGSPTSKHPMHDAPSGLSEACWGGEAQARVPALL